MNKNSINIWTLLSILLSLAAIGLSLLRIEPFLLSLETYIGIIVTMMSIIFTILIGYQIYNSLEINRKILSFDKQRNELLKENNRLQDEFKLMRAGAYFDRSNIAIALEKYNDAIFFLLNSISCYISLDNFFEYNSSFESITNNLKICLEKEKFIDKKDFKIEIDNLKKSSKSKILSKELQLLIEKIS